MDQSKEELADYENLFLDLVGIIGYGECFDRDKDYGSELGIVEGFVCAQPFQRMFIHWDGKVFPCCWDYKEQVFVGDASDTPLIDMWRGKLFGNIREHMKNGTYYKLPLCKNCYLPHSRLG